MTILTKKLKRASPKTADLGIRDQIIGIGTEVPLLDGSLTKYINFDNAASTPTLAEVLQAVNKLSYRIPLKKDDIVLVSLMEHHSNDLPWRGRARVERVGVDGHGRFDERHLDVLLAKYKKRVKLVTLTGASNVTGQMPNVH